MTSTRTTIAGALAINVPSIYWATLLPTAALVTSIVTLAGIGALLGAFTGWASPATSPRRASGPSSRSGWQPDQRGQTPNAGRDTSVAVPFGV